jgi:hypothetical protein
MAFHAERHLYNRHMKEPCWPENERARAISLLHDLVPVAAAQIAGREAAKGPLESALVQALCGAAPGGVTALRNTPCHIAGWDPQPGRVDLALTADNEPTLLGEAKVWDFGDTLWDVVKLLGASQSLRAISFMAVLGRARDFDPTKDCAELYEPGPAREYDVAATIARWRPAWTATLRGGRGRPRLTPARFRVEPVGVATPPAWPDHELRLVLVEIVGQGTIEFHDGWPAASA